ncbi:hypothetical protein CXB77_05170 [Chromatium okenii]|uniref:Uncharacterized protein n=2 Tax=Chromatium okenii TaxID=61644 RepID=A0A2S7XSW8_9GAMM|nr:hypothetical protein CXB77_18920 [Chromatium okenii]PQJ94718.1 hypothetical protein CXB77_18845 [Chromatium okenii]PQJ96816.1 hypothetical protein CXB77_05585 [Chromatium okenii]PQJ96825.1 hypothetical protein CXB77_05630 [Chromatium okenii]PQJ96909.1 hypothetical protein CXB77_05170 [Chromatium okenii]
MALAQIDCAMNATDCVELKNRLSLDDLLHHAASVAIQRKDKVLHNKINCLTPSRQYQDKGLNQ